MTKYFIAAAIALSALTGCADECERAQSKLEECSMLDLFDEKLECSSSVDECTARCVNDATCAELGDFDSLAWVCIAQCAGLGDSDGDAGTL